MGDGSFSFTALNEAAIKRASRDDFLGSGGEIAIDTIFLRHVANEIGLNRSVESDVTRARLKFAKQKFEEGSFAATIGTDNAEKIFGSDGEIEAFENMTMMIVKVELLDGNEIHRRASVSCAKLCDMRS